MYTLGPNRINYTPRKVVHHGTVERTCPDRVLLYVKYGGEVASNLIRTPNIVLLLSLCRFSGRTLVLSFIKIRGVLGREQLGYRTSALI